MKNMFFLFFTLLILSCFGSKDTINPSPKNTFIENKKLIFYSTGLNNKNRLRYMGEYSFYEKTQPSENEVSIFIDSSKKFQTYLGTGAAITDAAAETYYKMPKSKQEEILKAFFDKEKGIGYNIIRTNINSCDFSSDIYTYVNDNDSSLSSFDISHDKKYKIPFIKEAMISGKNIHLFASPWSPPAWMKTNNNMLHGGKLKLEHYETWANYFVKFIKSYQQEKIPVWGITIQNEPMATQRWESCIYTAEEEINFLKNALGPTMHKAGLQNVKIIGWDHNRDLLYQRASGLLNDKEAAKYLWGIGFHWYEPWSGGEPMHDNVKLVYESYPNTHLLFTEGCKEAFDLTKVDNWQLGEKYGINMIRDFNNGMVGFTDWNLMLDETGGPNHVQNFCFAPIHGNTKTGELIYTNAYYYIGHFSKFIEPGAKRIISSASRSQLLTTAFLNPNGETVIIILNQTEKAIKYFIWINGKACEMNIDGHEIQTALIKSSL